MKKWRSLSVTWPQTVCVRMNRRVYRREDRYERGGEVKRNFI